MRLPQPGESFAGYQVERVLGEGGFAVVFAAVEVASRSAVALKVLKPDTSTGYRPDTHARFERETRLVAGLHCEHTVALLDHGESAGLLYLVFERLGGRDLDEVLGERGRLAPVEVIELLRQILTALREAHAAGLVHRDIKPANIRVLSSDREQFAVKLLDFGIARSTDDGHPSITKTGELVGTPRYMSPEQLTGAPLGPSSDLYSLGLVALELLQGREVLAGGRWADQLDRLVTDHVFTSAELEAQQVGLLQVIQRMTARQLPDRYQTAGAVLGCYRIVRRGCSGRPISTPTRLCPSSSCCTTHGRSRKSPIAPAGCNGSSIPSAFS